jgi:hypothetical protein
MITKELAVYLGQRGGELHHTTLTQGGRKPIPLRARVNGKCQTWKRDLTRWRLPMKHGLKQCFDLEPFNAREWVYAPYEAAKPELKLAHKDETFCRVLAFFVLPPPGAKKEEYLPVLADRAEELGLLKLAHFLRNGILPV